MVGCLRSLLFLVSPGKERLAIVEKMPVVARTGRRSRMKGKGIWDGVVPWDSNARLCGLACLDDSVRFNLSEYACLTGARDRPGLLSRCRSNSSCFNIPQIRGAHLGSRTTRLVWGHHQQQVLMQECLLRARPPAVTLKHKRELIGVNGQAQCRRPRLCSFSHIPHRLLRSQRRPRRGHSRCSS